MSAAFLFMKKTILLILSCFFLAMASVGAFARNIGEPYKCIYNIIDTADAHVTGQSPTIKIQRASDGYWLDFSDDTFKSSGWTSKSVVMSEDAAEGFYHYTFTPPASEISAEQYVFLFENSDAVYGDHQAITVDYQDNALNKYVNGVKDGGAYNGIETMIRTNR